MQDLTNLKAYQKKALQVKKIENKFKQSQLRKKLMSTRKYLVDSQELMKKHEAETSDINLRFDGLSKKINEAISVLDEIDVAMENVVEDESMAEIKMLQKNAKAQDANIKNHERDIKKFEKRLHKIDDDLDKIAANVPRAKKEYTQLKKLYDAELAKVNEETLPIKKEMKKFEKSIDKTLIKKYNQIAKSHPIVLVEMKGRMCMGCNMELPASFAKRIAESEMPMECENCGRLLYVK